MKQGQQQPLLLANHLRQRARSGCAVENWGQQQFLVWGHGCGLPAVLLGIFLGGSNGEFFPLATGLCKKERRDGCTFDGGSSLFWMVTPYSLWCFLLILASRPMQRLVVSICYLLGGFWFCDLDEFWVAILFLGVPGLARFQLWQETFRLLIWGFLVFDRIKSGRLDYGFRAHLCSVLTTLGYEGFG